MFSKACEFILMFQSRDYKDMPNNSHIALCGNFLAL